MGFDFESLTEATSGAVGGLLSTTFLYPLDTCKTKYQAEVRAGASRKYGYESIIFCLKLFVFVGLKRASSALLPMSPVFFLMCREGELCCVSWGV
jgi:hypothetical protein